MLDMTKINIDPSSVSADSRNAATLKQRPEYYLMVTANNALKEKNISPLKFIAREFADTNGHRSAIVARYIGIVNAETLEDLEQHRSVIEGFMSNTDYNSSVNEVPMAELISSMGNEELAREIAALYRIPIEEARIEANKQVVQEKKEEPKETITQAKEEAKKEKNMTLKKKKAPTAAATAVKSSVKTVASASNAATGLSKKEREERRARIERKKAAQAEKKRIEEEELARQQEEEMERETIDEVLEIVETNSNKVLTEMSQFPLVISRDPELALAWAELMNGTLDFLVKAQELREKYDAFLELNAKASEDKFVDDEQYEEEYEEDEEDEDEE